MATRDSAWSTKHGQKTLVCCRDITVTKEGAAIGEIFLDGCGCGRADGPCRRIDYNCVIFCVSLGDDVVWRVR